RAGALLTTLLRHISTINGFDNLMAQPLLSDEPLTALMDHYLDTDALADGLEEKRDAMQSLVLPPPARQALAQAALTYRYGDEHQPVTTADILTPRRREDYGKDLWSAYQTIQENMLKGGISGRSAKGKRIHTRAIHSIDTDIKLNRALWVMAETMLESLR
ncbi:TPA: DUF932 domain-containing protein, partial [Escherichia coli]